MARGLLALMFASPVFPRAASSSEPVPTPAYLTPPPLYGQVVVRDARRHRMIVLGGATPGGYLPEPYTIWTWPAPTPSGFAPLSANGYGPMPRSGFAAIYDSLHDRVFAIGGFSIPWSASDDTLWELRLAPPVSWRPIELPEPRPVARVYPSMWIDERSDRLVLYGGALRESPSVTLGDVWTLALDSLAAWRQAGDSPAGVRQGAASARMPAGEGNLVFGGSRPNAEGYIGAAGPDTWQVRMEDTLRWIEWPVGAPGTRPDPHPPQVMSEGSAATGPLLFGGPYFLPDAAGTVRGTASTIAPAEAPGDAWRFDPAMHSWELVTPAGTAPRGYPLAAAWDPDSQRVFVMASVGPAGFSVDLLPTPRWRNLSPTPRSFIDRGRGGFVVDPGENLALCQAEDGIWVWNCADTSGWRKLVWPWGRPPTASVLVVDSARHELLGAGSGGYQTRPPDSVWALPFGAFGAPRRRPLRADSTFSAEALGWTWDAPRLRELVVTRSAWESTMPPALWALDVGDTLGWHRVPTRGVAPDLATVVAIHADAIRDRMFLLRADWDPLTGGTQPGELWQLSFADTATWTRLLTGGPPLAWIVGSTPAYDASRDRLRFFGSDNSGIYIDEVDLTPSPAWRPRTRIPPCFGISNMAFAADAAHQRVLALDTRGSLLAIGLADATVPSASAPELRSEGGIVTLQARTDAAPDVAIRVQRSLDGGRDWSLAGIAHPDASGLIAVNDTLPGAARRIGYRLAAASAGGERTIAESWLDAAPVARLRVGSVRPSPTSGAFSIELGLPASGSVTLELFDVTGRRIAGPWREVMPAGARVMAAPWPSPDRPGLYLLRASAAGGHATARVVVIR